MKYIPLHFVIGIAQVAGPVLFITGKIRIAYDICKDVRKLSICMSVKYCPFI